MKIRAVTSRQRNDIKVLLACEHCGAERSAWGYADHNFQYVVVPQMKCDACGRSGMDGADKVGGAS